MSGKMALVALAAAAALGVSRHRFCGSGERWQALQWKREAVQPGRS
jgi:hypothetical protein